MLPPGAINPSLSYQDMRRGLKRKLFFALAGVFLIVLLLAGFSDRDTKRIYDELLELRLNYSKLERLCSKQQQNTAVLPIIYAITPTYARPVQKAELTRLSHTLVQVPALHWVVVEDAPKPSALVQNLLNRSGVKHSLLTAPTPKEWKLREKDPNWKKPRGVLQRNKALKWLRENLKKDEPAVIYFADDDNVYSLELFEEMRWTKAVSVWPVGLVGGLMVERPILDPVTGRVVSFNAAWRPERPFPIDMAGFAVSAERFLSRPAAKFSLTSERGYQESQLLQALTTREELEPKADKCTKVYVWHTRTEAPMLYWETMRRKKGQASDADIEV